MACAFRPRLRPNSMASRYGSQKLVDETHLGLFRSEPLNSTPNPVITSFSLAGFQVILIGRFWVIAEVSRSQSTLPMHWTRLTRLGSFIGTSSPQTSLSPSVGTPRFWISVWRRSVLQAVLQVTLRLLTR